MHSRIPYSALLLALPFEAAHFAPNALRWSLPSPTSVAITSPIERDSPLPHVHEEAPRFEPPPKPGIVCSGSFYTNSVRAISSPTSGGVYPPWP